MAGCTEDPGIEETLPKHITHFKITLHDQLGGPPVVMSYSDADGNGTNSPLITAQPLRANTTYQGVIELWDESKDPVLRLNDIIANDMESHQFFYSISKNLDLRVNYDDQDENGNPVGMAITLQTGKNSIGQLVVTLRNQLNKAGAGVADGDITFAGGDTDLYIQFILSVQ